MKTITQRRKKAMKNMAEAAGTEWLGIRLEEVISRGKAAFDEISMKMGKMLAETIMYMEREEIAGPDYRPKDSSLKKWASQQGSVYIGGHKVKIQHPRLRSQFGEVSLKSYASLKDPRQFSDEMLSRALRGLSGRKYSETIGEMAESFGISPSSISNRFIEATTRQLSELLERDLSGIKIFAIFLDTVHRGGVAFIVALGLDVFGHKHNLGFWEGATENHEIAKALLSDLENRGLKIGRKTLFVTDGGSGIIKCLKERYGKKLLHQRCTIHKDRNIQRHLPKRYRKEAHRRYRTALKMKQYDDAKNELKSFERWLREINESAADSLLEAREEILTLHRLKVPELLRQTLHSTNPIEAVFSQVRKMEGNIKRYRGTKMSRRWLATCLLASEKQFRTIKGFESIPSVIKNIEWEQQESDDMKLVA